LDRFNRRCVTKKGRLLPGALFNLRVSNWQRLQMLAEKRLHLLFLDAAKRVADHDSRALFAGLQVGGGYRGGRRL
jgi:hypothetical protein